MIMWVSEPVATALGDVFSSIDAVWRLKGEKITSDKMSSVERVTLDGRVFYVKRYLNVAGRLASLLGFSRARLEWENLQHFHRWGLPVADLVAYGQARWGLSSRRGYVVTAEVQGSVDMATLAINQPQRFQFSSGSLSLIHQVARAARVMHQHRFAHNDLKWRNVLVSGANDEPLIHLIDCPSGRFWWGPFFQYRRIKDLACLDKVARVAVTRSQRLRFYLAYKQINKLSAADKREIAKVVGFFSGRE